MARSGGTMIQGRVIECTLAQLLNADFPRLGTSSWDLRMRDCGALVEVRSRARSFSLLGTQHVDVWMFIAKAGSEPPAYFVATPSEVAAPRRRSPRISIERARTVFRHTREEDLAAIVKASAVR
jgi:hypothetical protein